MARPAPDCRPSRDSRGTGRRRNAVRDGMWKLLMDPGGAREQLYDLDSDPGETTDLAARRHAIRGRLRGQLDSWIAALPK